MGSIDPTIPVIIVGIPIALVIFCLYSIQVRRSAAYDESPALPIATGRSTGLDFTLIRNFPTFFYSEVKYLKMGIGTLECAICLNDFEDEETLRLLPKCDHAFHLDCIDSWLSSHTTCPVCRIDLAEPDHHSDHPIPNLVTVEPNNVSSSVAIQVADEGTTDDGVSIKSTICSKFPRSHSTGHSLVQPGESVDRFTLKLPDQLRHEMITRALNRTTTSFSGCEEESNKRGKSYKRLGSLDRPDRWMFKMALPMFAQDTLQNSNRLIVMGR